MHKLNFRLFFLVIGSQLKIFCSLIHHLMMHNDEADIFCAKLFKLYGSVQSGILIYLHAGILGLASYPKWSG